jgi:hypothetical protein
LRHAEYCCHVLATPIRKKKRQGYACWGFRNATTGMTAVAHANKTIIARPLPGGTEWLAYMMSPSVPVPNGGILRSIP